MVSVQFCERMWTVVDLIVAFVLLGLWHYHREEKKNNSWPMLLLGVALIGEGTFFLARDTGLEEKTDGATLAIQFIAGGVWWQFVVSLMHIKRKQPTNHVRVGGVCMVLALLLALVFLLTFQKAKPVAGLLFVNWFEPAQFLIWSTALFKAITHFSDQQQILAVCLAVSHLCLYLSHVSLVYLDKVAKVEYYHFPPYIVQCVGIIGMTISLHHMVEEGMFNESDKERGYEAAKDEAYNAISSDEEGTGCEEFDIGRWAISPERCWTLAYWFIMSTYSFGAFLLFNVSKPDLRVDPILRTYNAFHPCVIIDYMPGNLWAQLTFLLYVYSLLMSATVSLIRAARTHNGVLMVISSQAYGVAWIGLPILVLACTFNPTYTSVLSHSIPYMVCVGSIGFFILSELVVLYSTTQTTTGRHVACYIYSTVMLLATGYAILFMSKLLGSTTLIDVTLPVTDPRNVLQPQELHVSPLTTALAFSILPLHWVRPWFNPLTEKPVSANIEVYKGNWESLESKSTSMRHPHNKWRIVLKASTLGFWGRSISMAGFALAYFFNMVFAEESHTIRGKFTNVPGAAIIALSWSVGVPLMALQAFVLATYVRLRFRKGEFAFFFVATAIFASLTSVLAHGGTVPHAPDWYIGPELYAIALLLWGAAECILLQKESEMTPLVIFKLTVGALTGLMMIINVFSFGTFWFVGFLCMWAVYSFCDPLHVSMVITNIEIGNVDNSPETLKNNFFQWAWYDEKVE